MTSKVEAALVRDAEGCPHSGAVPDREHIDETRTAILCLLNKERAQHGLRALQRSPLLQLASQRHSEDMAKRDFFEHDTPEGLDSAARIVAAGYPRVHSPGHRANILRPEFAEVGVGAVHTTDFGGVSR